MGSGGQANPQVKMWKSGDSLVGNWNTQYWGDISGDIGRICYTLLPTLYMASRELGAVSASFRVHTFSLYLYDWPLPSMIGPFILI